MNIVKKYNVKLIPLTDIHIGSGKDIEAYEYTIKDGYMYRIDMSEILDNMSDSKKEKFYKELKKNNIITLRSWIFKNYEESWGYVYKEKVSNEFSKYYEKKISGTENKNENSQLNILEFIGYNDKKYIPGSSIKGALRTAFIFNYILDSGENYKIKKIKNESQIMESEILKSEREDRYGNKKNKKGEKLGLEPKKDPFKTVKIFDTEEIELEQFSVNSLKIKEGNLTCEILRGRYEELDDSKNIEEIFFAEGINFNIVLAEYILKNNFKMDYKKKLRIKELIYALDNKAEEILDFEIEKERIKDSYEIKRFYEQLKNLFEKIKSENSNICLIRIGKYAGFNDKTINLLINESSQNSRTVLDENNYPMGWALIKVKEVKE